MASTAKEASGARASSPKLQIYSTSDTLSTFWREKYVKHARKYWDVFYKRHQDKFFKSRHNLDKEGGKYFSGAGRKVILEVGCGAGNYFPTGCDTHKDLVDTRVSAFVCDLTIDDLSKQISSSSVDIITMAPCVSREDVYVMKNNRNVLKHAFYFSNELLTSLFEENGFDVEELDLCCKQVENRSTELVMNRRWVQAVFHISDDTNSSTKTEAATEVDHLGQEKIVLEVNEKILKKPVNDLEADISDGVVMEMSGVLPSNDNEVIELELGDLTFKIEVLSKVYQHTCKSTGLMLWESARFMASV